MHADLATNRAYLSHQILLKMFNVMGFSFNLNKCARYDIQESSDSTGVNVAT